MHERQNKGQRLVQDIAMTETEEALISWDVHERYFDTLFKYVTRPAQPGYRKVSLRQVLRADKLAFAKLAEQGEDIRADASGKQSVLQEYELLVALLPLPDNEGKGKKGKTKTFGKQDRYEPYAPGFGKGYRAGPWKGGKGKGSAKGGKPQKGGGKSEWLPIRSSDIKEPQPGTNAGAVFATAFSWASVPTQIAKRAITTASYSLVGVTTRSRSAP